MPFIGSPPPPLTTGALAGICQVSTVLPIHLLLYFSILHKGEQVVEPVLQVLGCKEVLGAGEARWIKNPGGESGPVKIAKQHPKSGFVSCKFVRFRLLLNDGDYSNSFVLLSSKVHIYMHI